MFDLYLLAVTIPAVAIVVFAVKAALRASQPKFQDPYSKVSE